MIISKLKKDLKDNKNKNYDFEVEDCIAYGEKQLNILPPESNLFKFHKIAVAGFIFELNIHTGFTHELKKDMNTGGQYKTIKVLGKPFKISKTGAKWTAMYISTLRPWLRMEAEDLKIRWTYHIRRSAHVEMQLFKEGSMELYYYKTGLRFLRVIGFR